MLFSALVIPSCCLTSGHSPFDMLRLLSYTEICITPNVKHHLAKVSGICQYSVIFLLVVLLSRLWLPPLLHSHSCMSSDRTAFDEKGRELRLHVSDFALSLYAET